MASIAATARPAQTRAIAIVRAETLISASRLGRDFRELLAYALCGLDGDLDLLGPRVYRGLVDLDVFRTGALEIARLVADDLGEREHRVPARGIRLVVRPVEERVRTGQHSLHGLRGERLRVFEPANGHGLRPRDLSRDHWLVVVTVPVRAEEPADLEALETFGEVRDHVTPVHLTVHQDVEPDVLLPTDPLGGRLALQLLKLRGAELAARRLGTRLGQIVGLAERPDRRGRQNVLGHAGTFSPVTSRAPSTRAASFARAMSRGRYSSDVVGASLRWSRGTSLRARSA